jgi:hypothetical protein
MTEEVYEESSVSLLMQGKSLRKEGRLDEAIELLARGVEAKMNEEGIEISGGLAEYLIEYADSLLCKEEANSAELLAPAGVGDVSESDDEEGTSSRFDSAKLAQPVIQAGEDEEEEEILSDLQLAWESFEHARLCLLAKSSDATCCKDLSFVHCRLGDIQALQDQFSASISDYAQAIEYGMDADFPARKTAGLLVSLCQTIQVFMTSEEIKSDQFNALEFVEKFKGLFKTVCERYKVEVILSTGNAVSLIARDGFLISNELLNTVQNEDVTATINELKACAEDCLQQHAEIEQAKMITPGVTTGGFAHPSGSEVSSTIITVSVKRKIVSGETNERDGSELPRSEPLAKKQKETDHRRAEKAKLVD